MNKKYFILESKTFAQALNLLGFEFYVFDDRDGKKVYSFENTKLFQEAYKNLCELRKHYRNILNNK